MAMTTLDDAYLLRIEQMYRAILVTNDELLTLNGGYKDVSALSDAADFNSGVLKFREKQEIFRDNEAKNLDSFAELSSEELIAFDQELSLVLRQMEISLDLKNPEELVELLYGFPTEDYYSVSNKFGFIFSFLNEEQTHILIDQYCLFINLITLLILFWQRKSATRLSSAINVKIQMINKLKKGVRF